VVLLVEKASRVHCVIEALDGRMTVKDLGSTNGTFVNGVRVLGVTELRSGVVIAAGGARMRVVPEVKTSTLVGESLAMRRLRKEISMAAPSTMSVLIHGETGTGKELVARALHVESGRRGALVVVNCAAIPADLVESELFGHERGAFTGAQQRRIGYFELADGGTLFLDEIGELPLGLQSKLLRALETGTFRPVGASREVQVDVRVVSATHVDLGKAVTAGRFRADLYYRLVQHTLATPSLRARRDDLGQLVRQFLVEMSTSATMSAAAMDLLMAHDWPGNVRELKHVLQRAAVLAEADVIGPDDVRFDRVSQTHADDNLLLQGRRYDDLEKEILQRALRRAHGNKRKAAAELGIPKSTLCDKVKRYGLEE